MADSILPTKRSDRVAVVVNGNAKQVTDDLVEILDQIIQSGDLYVSRSLDEGRDIARIIVERGYPTVLTGGGDGTFAQTVTWIDQEAERQGKSMPRFGLLRLGTGNAIAWVLGAQDPKGRGVFADLARLRTEGSSRELRLLSLNGRLTPFAGLGTDAITLTHYEEMKKLFQRTPVLKRFASGGLVYAAAILGRTAPLHVVKPHHRVRIVNEGEDAQRLGDDGQPEGEPYGKGQVLYDGPTRMTVMSTIPYYGFGARIFPFATDRDDRFSLRVIDINSVDVIRHIRKIWDGSFRDPRVHDFLAERVSLHFEEPMPLQIGGDPAGSHTVVEVGLHPKPIEVVDFYGPPPI